MFYNNNIEKGKNGIVGNYQLNHYIENINADPEFVSASNGSGASFDGVSANWNISTNSPCINMGENSTSLYYGNND